MPPPLGGTLPQPLMNELIFGLQQVGFSIR